MSALYFARRSKMGTRCGVDLFVFLPDAALPVDVIERVGDALEVVVEQV